MHRGLLPQPQSAHTDMLQDIFQIPPAEPGLKSTHKQQKTGYGCCPLEQVLVEDRTRRKARGKKSLLHHLWHRL